MYLVLSALTSSPISLVAATKACLPELPAFKLLKQLGGCHVMTVRPPKTPTFFISVINQLDAQNFCFITPIGCVMQF